MQQPLECKSHDGGNLMIISYDKEAAVCTIPMTWTGEVSVFNKCLNIIMVYI